jgi:transcriptional regulator with PAS, ATPase and Fis domain
VAVNFGALPDTLLESKLFGHKKVAFAGAGEEKMGRLALAEKGTLFLDEIGDMGLGLQSKLLRVLQDREIRPVGSTQSTKIDVRIITATNRDLQKQMEQERFREDLYYRLNVIPIHIPPLRDRPEDLPLLVDAFVKKHSDGARHHVSRVAMERLMKYPWKGNARELENVIERALALSSDEQIDLADLPAADLDENGGRSGVDEFPRSAAQRRLSLREVEDLYIEEVMRLAGGNKVQAAKILGIDRKTLYRRAERSVRRGV